jgi:hypothetical protein
MWLDRVLGKDGFNKPFQMKAFNLGLRKDLNFDKIEDVLDIIEGPNRR